MLFSTFVFVMKDIKKVIIEIIDIVKKQLPNVKGIYMFGSYADGTDRSDSDIDIAVQVKGGLTGAEKLNLASAFVKDIDIQVDLVDFEKASTLLQYEIIKNGTLIYDGDTLYNDETFLKTLGIYYDYIIETREYRADIKKRKRVYG